MPSSVDVKARPSPIAMSALAAPWAWYRQRRTGWPLGPWSPTPSRPGPPLKPAHAGWAGDGEGLWAMAAAGTFVASAATLIDREDS